MQEFNFHKPKTLPGLLNILASTDGRILAGGTDIIPKMKRSQLSVSTLVDISQIEPLCFIQREDQRIKIGALITHQEIAESALLKEANPALVTAAETVGSLQTRNRGTLGGNIANASPAADLIPPLIICDADVHIYSKLGERKLPLNELITGPGATRLTPEELIHSVSFRIFTGSWGVSFIKVGKRNGMAISVVSGAAMVKLGTDDKVKDSRICLGSVAPRVVRSPRAEMCLEDRVPSTEIIDRAAQAAINLVEMVQGCNDLIHGCLTE